MAGRSVAMAESRGEAPRGGMSQLALPMEGREAPRSGAEPTTGRRSAGTGAGAGQPGRSGAERADRHRHSGGWPRPGKREAAGLTLPTIRRAEAPRQRSRSQPSTFFCWAAVADAPLAEVARRGGLNARHDGAAATCGGRPTGWPRQTTGSRARRRSRRNSARQPGECGGGAATQRAPLLSVRGTTSRRREGARRRGRPTRAAGATAAWEERPAAGRLPHRPEGWAGTLAKLA